MSTIWTPDGERPVNRPQPNPGNEGRTPTGFGNEGPGDSPNNEVDQNVDQQMEQLRQQLASTPAEVIVSNHCFGLFELAALHLSNHPPKLADAQLAIDALSALVENLTGRLGEGEPQLREGLNQLRLAFVQIRQAAES